MFKVLFVPILCMLAGCSMFSEDNYAQHKEMYIAHEEYMYNTISDQASSIAAVANNAIFDTKLETALFKVIAVQSIERLQYVPFRQKAPTTGYDVVNTVAGGVPAMIVGLTSYGIAKKSYQYGGASNSINGEVINVDSSFNRNDTSILGSENSNTSPFSVEQYPIASEPLTEQ